MHWMNYDGWGGGMSLGWIFMILFWLLVILGIFYLVKVLSGRGKEKPEGETALEILKKRYARGEISKEEFVEMKEDLKEKD